MTTVRGRLAPSPTGAQHLGNARTYLIAWLAARSVSGRLVLRIEDIDSPRVKAGAMQQAIDDLRWLGLDWDEGPDVGGPHAPYVQTQRTEGYANALRHLITHDFVYPCTCTRTDVLEAASAPHLGQEGPRYPGTCSLWHVGDPVPEPETYCWRFRVQEIEDVFDDRLAGRMACRLSRELGDFPITRKTGEAAYQLAVVVDDATMEINQVVRGDDLIPSAFRQRQLQQALQLPSVEYAHVPLVIGTDGRRLAKRHGDTRLATYRAQGVPAERIVGLLAWSIGLLPMLAPVQPQELLKEFGYDRLRREPFTILPQYEAWLRS